MPNNRIIRDDLRPEFVIPKLKDVAHAKAEICRTASIWSMTKKEAIEFPLYKALAQHFEFDLTALHMRPSFDGRGFDTFMFMDDELRYEHDDIEPIETVCVDCKTSTHTVFSIDGNFYCKNCYYPALERKHLGDPIKMTGIYHADNRVKPRSEIHGLRAEGVIMDEHGYPFFDDLIHDNIRPSRTPDIDVDFDCPRLDKLDIIGLPIGRIIGLTSNGYEIEIFDDSVHKVGIIGAGRIPHIDMHPVTDTMPDMDAFRQVLNPMMNCNAFTGKTETMLITKLAGFDAEEKKPHIRFGVGAMPKRDRMHSASQMRRRKK